MDIELDCFCYCRSLVRRLLIDLCGFICRRPYEGLYLRSEAYYLQQERDRSDIFPSTKTVASLKLPDYDSGKLVTQYSHEHATFSTAVSANRSPVIDFSATIGTPGIAFGAESSYATESHKFLKYNAGVSMTKPNSGASVIL
ncbi:hypothetical protein SAY86_011157 [Trapa natans]|uniref:Uncharacterized protein n=1 Tax=Trapa natans TaxID=22666 RepID=A0AAN7R0L0_TRANT|nr:hypothetical protein SAY86_011157 [Trapa natans]